MRLELVAARDPQAPSATGRFAAPKSTLGVARLNRVTTIYSRSSSRPARTPSTVRSTDG
jgi:hypothetical protein